MESPLKKEWLDKRDLAQVVGPQSCFVIKDRSKIISVCNKDGKTQIIKKGV